MSPIPISVKSSARVNPETCKCRCDCDFEKVLRRAHMGRFFQRAWLAAAVVSVAGAAGMEHIAILRDETQYYITPWLTRLHNGDLLITVREAHARGPEQRGHLDPTARGVFIRSRDGGRTWSPKAVFDDETYRFSQTQDVPVTQLSDGT